MSLSASLQSTVDAIFDDVVSQLSTLQETYKTETVVDEAGNEYVRGHYWQGVAVVDGIPADGAELSVNLSKKPTDQTEDWSDVGVSLDATIPLRVEVHSYVGPSGQGYVIVGTVEEDNSTYQRSKNIGPETFREQEWIEVMPNA